MITYGVALLLPGIAQAQAAPSEEAQRQWNMVYSDQTARPVFYGFASALMLGLYPRRFGDDVIPRQDSNERWTPAMQDFMLPKAQATFEKTRGALWLGLVLVGVMSMFRRFRRNKAARPSLSL